MAAIVHVNANVILRIGEEFLQFDCPSNQKKLPCGRWVVLNPISRKAGIGASPSEALANLRNQVEGFFGSFETGILNDT